MKSLIQSILFITLFSFSAQSQVCVSLNFWNLQSENGDGTCSYMVSLTVDSGNGASGTATFSIDGVTVFVQPNCVCNPSTINFPITVDCNSTVVIDVFYDAPGMGNDCTGSTGDIALPVEWARKLSAKKIGDKIQLDFATSSEINSSHFDILHSSDGKNYSVIGRIEAQGNSFQTAEYLYIDVFPSKGMNYYYLKQYDLDGHYSNSSTTSILYSSNKISINPNPASDQITIASPTETSVQVLSSVGELIFVQDLQKGNTTLSIAALEKGLYYLQFSNGNVEKLIVY